MNFDYIQNIICICSISKQAFIFQRHGDDYGKLFSIVQPVAKIFPGGSDYDVIREASNSLYTFFKVCQIYE